MELFCRKWALKNFAKNISTGYNCKMDKEVKNTENIDNTTKPKHKRVHVVLAHAYLFYLFAFILGTFLDFNFHLQVANQTLLTILGVLFLMLGPLLIYWAQKTSHHFKKHETKTLDSFLMGPYRYVRNPTHLGLFIMILGFGMIVNAFFIILFTIISFIITKIIFLKQEQKILEHKYGEHYIAYKKKVKF